METPGEDIWRQACVGKRGEEQISPSVVRDFCDTEEQSIREKALAIEDILGGISIEAQPGLQSPRQDEQISASKGRKEGESGERPVQLVIKYRRELLFPDTLHLLPEGARIVYVETGYAGGSEKERLLILRECSRRERTLQNKLLFREEEERGEVYVTTEERRFFITKRRLMGEILRAQRKAERMKQERRPHLNLVLTDLFLRKLCVLKTYSEKKVCL
jgi:hypothetical protein